MKEGRREGGKEGGKKGGGCEGGREGGIKEGQKRGRKEGRKEGKREGGGGEGGREGGNHRANGVVPTTNPLVYMLIGLVPEMQSCNSFMRPATSCKSCKSQVSETNPLACATLFGGLSKSRWAKCLLFTGNTDQCYKIFRTCLKMTDLSFSVNDQLYL